MKRVGIIGGMGSLASVDLYKKIVLLTSAKCDQDHILISIDNNSQIPDRSEFIFGKGENPLPFLIDSANRLKNSGCEAICLACNTAHFFAKDIVKNCDIRLLNMIEITVNALKDRYPNVKNVAVIGTTVTRKTKMYDRNLEKFNINSVDISEQNQQNIMECIYKGVKAGKIKEYAKLFNETIKSIDADVFIAACTEIPILLPYLKENIKFVDATEELAKEVIKFANS